MQPNSTPAPLYDDALDDLLHDNIVNITGITADLVRPRYQPEPATHPDATTNWVAFGIATYDSDVFAYQGHDPAGNGGLGTNSVERDEMIVVNLSFYGPNNLGYMAQYREGIQVESNRWDINAQNMNLVEVGQVVNLPALLKDRWVKRLDTKVTFRRRVSRVYNVPSLIGNPVGLNVNNDKTSVLIPTNVH